MKRWQGEMVAALEQSPRTAAARLAPDVFLVDDDGVARLLDFGRGRFYALNPIASRMVRLALDRGADEAAERLAAEYAAQPKQVRTDLAALLSDLQGKGLLATRRRRGVRAALGALARWAGRVLFRPLHGPAACGPRGVSFLLTQAWVSLRLFGWVGTVTLWGGRRAAADASSPADRAERLHAVDRLVRETAARKLAFPAVCKERAVVGWRLLRNVHGLDADLVVGVRLHPFGAHAWVECDGAVVTDDPAHCELYTPVARYR